STDWSASTCARFVRALAPIAVNSPPMYQPPLPSGIAAITVPLTRGKFGAGAPDTTSTGTPEPVTGPTNVKLPPRQSVVPRRPSAVTWPFVMKKSGRPVCADAPRGTSHMGRTSAHAHAAAAARAALRGVTAAPRAAAARVAPKRITGAAPPA